jgi:hypothetical protein
VAALSAAFVAATAPGSASAAFSPVGLPPDQSLWTFAAAGDAWAAITNGDGSYHAWLSENAGASWQPLDTGSQADWMDISAGPDGDFYIAARVLGVNYLERFAPTGGSPQIIPYGLTASSNNSELAAPSWDAQGRMWVLFIDAVDTSDRELDTLEVAQVENGSPQRLVTAPDPNGIGLPALDASGPVPIAFDGESSFAAVSSSLVKISETAGLPQLRVGGLTFFSDGLSADGGRSIVDASGPYGGTIMAVKGTPSLIVQNGVVLRPFSSTLMVPSTLTVPPFTSSVWASRGGLVAVVPSRGAAGAIYFSAGTAPPPLPSTFGAPVASSRRMVGRANRIRAASGLPPLLDDARIARAADNHSRYWTLNRGPAQILDLHSERPGTPGFTGVDELARCKATGTTCDAEIMFPGLGATAAVNGWTPTLFHGSLLLSPLAWSAGGAVHGRGPAVMDFGPTEGLVTGPTPFPRGRYLGNPYYHFESPDPRTLCHGRGNRIGPLYGPTIFLNAPTGAILARMTVVGPRHRRLHGCTIADLGEFVFGSPVRPHTLYRVTADWHLGSVPETTSWTFRT